MIPKIRRIKVRTHREELVCDKCDMGYMKFTGISFTSNPPQNQHKCTNCGHTINILNKTYPMITYEDR